MIAAEIAEDSRTAERYGVLGISVEGAIDIGVVRPVAQRPSRLLGWATPVAPVG